MKLEDLKQPYSEKLFFDINNQLIDLEFNKSSLTVEPDSPKFVKNVKYLGEYTDLSLHVLVIRHSSNNDARVGVGTDIFRIMKKYSLPNAIIASFSDENEGWRYSLVTTNMEINSDGKITREFSDPKRYSFLLGPEQKVVTPFRQLVDLGKVSNIAQLRNRFSLEVVNDEFYKSIYSLYDELVGTKDIARKLKFPGSDEDSHEFAVRLIGRIIFAWFLKEKKSKNNNPLIPNEILSRAAANTNNYYHSILAQLFFQVLNKPHSQRTSKYNEEPYRAIPYLNGGLFNPDGIDNYRFDASLEISVPGLIDVPDAWLRKLFDLLESYNFTVDENTSYDIDLSIDPEMLGRIFENLLARINPETGETVRNSTGSFYTPREIVEYMVDESLAMYINSNTKVSKKKIRALLSYDLIDDEEYPLNKEEKNSIIESLSTLRILDPACGSGAFPIGILQKTIFMLQRIDPDGKQWLLKQLAGASPELRHHLEKEFENKNFDYLRKLGIIRESIYGVDIQPIATEISRLRCFLTLVVEQTVEDGVTNRGIEPLPNLDFKFVTANSLIKLEVPKSPSLNQSGLFDDKTGIEELKRLRDDYFSSHNSVREKIKIDFVRTQNQMLQNMIANHTHGITDITQRLSAWDPFSYKASDWFDPEWMFGVNHGFDIVIGNPPYIASYGRHAKKFSGDAMKYFIKNYTTFESVAKRKTVSLNTVMLFIERGYLLTKDTGTLSYIVDQAILNVEVYKFTRKFLMKNALIKEIVTDLKFQQAIAEACIVTASKEKPFGNYDLLWKKKFIELPPLAVNTAVFESKNQEFILSSNSNIIDTIDQKSTRLGECAYTSTGMQIIPEYFLSDDDDVLSLPKWHKAVFSNNIEKYSIQWPSDKQKAKYITYDTELQSEIRKMLQEKLDKGEKVRAPETLSIGSSEKEYRFKTPKIILSQTVSNANGQINLQACLDETVGYYGNVSIHLIKHDDVSYLKFILGILNSAVVRFYAIDKKLILGAEPGSKKTPQIRKLSMDKLPIINLDYEKQIPIIKLVDEILSITLSENYSSSDEKKSHVEALQSRIDQYVYEMYEFNADQITVIEGDVKNDEQ